MTTEQKAKAYDESLIKAKELLDSPRTCFGIVQLKDIFPELRGSEDESLKNKSGYYKGGKFWKASTLWQAVKNKIPQRVPNRYILQDCTWNISSLRAFADEVKNVQEAELDYPIILDINGNILDGAHRVVKAYLQNKDIDVVYLGDDEWPEPDYDEEKAVKESEDERIRKGLIEVVSDIAGSWPFEEHKITKKEALAYLEKQKDQNHDGKKWIYEDDYNKDMERCFNDGKDEVLENLEKYGLQKEQKPEMYSPLCDTIKDKIREYIVNHFTIDTTVKTDVKSIVKAMEEGVRLGKESQKPAKWNEEDTKMLNSILLHLNVSFHEMNDSEKRMFTWLQEFPGRFNLKQNPAWGEEDEKIEKAIESVIRIYGKTQGEFIAGYDMDTLIVHLRTAFNRVHYWNSKDKDVVVEILRGLRKGILYEEAQEIADEMLKSLRPQPHWKPSKEEMEALDVACSGKLWYGEIYLEGLKRIREQLKKL